MNPLAGTLKSLAEVFDSLRIPYVIGGSMASSARGVVRATFDVDVVAAIAAAQSDRLAKELGRDWYAEPEQMRQAIAAHRSFNLIHIPLGNKVDIFPATGEFHWSQLRRASRISLPFLDDPTKYPVATAEDILLAKLRWYADGGGVSERQWRDICGIVAANPSLDLEYLDLWAAQLGIEEMLAQALPGR
jgi:hypothetical protein